MKVFVYQIGKVNGRLRANGVLLISGRLNDWFLANYERIFTMHVLGKPLITSLKVTTESSTDWVVSDPEGLTEKRPFLAKARIEHRLQLAELQPKSMFDIEADLADCDLPLVLSEQRGDGPRVYAAELECYVATIDELPEVAEYVRRELEEAEGDRHAMLAVKHLKIPTNLPLPSDTWLPCKLENDADAVYRITGSAGRNLLIELWVLNGGPLHAGTKLMSRYGDGRFEIGRIIFASEFNSGKPHE